MIIVFALIFQIHRLLNSGLTLEEVWEELDIGVKCGKCLSHLYDHHHGVNTDNNYVLFQNCCYNNYIF